MTRRVFYVLFFDDPKLQATLNAMRFIANPDVKTPAHITIRGPYSQPYHMPKKQELIRNTEVFADGVDAFFSNEQNTVFIKCQATTLREVWKKDDYGFNPHITIYDGSSRNLAKMLLNRLSGLEIRFSFVVNQLSKLTTYKGQYSNLLRIEFDEDIVSSIVGRKVRVFDLDMLSSHERVNLIVPLARSLADFSSSPASD